MNYCIHETYKLFFRSLKRRFEQELSEAEALNEHLKTAESEKELISAENIENAKFLLKE